MHQPIAGLLHPKPLPGVAEPCCGRITGLRVRSVFLVESVSLLLSRVVTRAGSLTVLEQVMERT